MWAGQAKVLRLLNREHNYADAERVKAHWFASVCKLKKKIPRPAVINQSQGALCTGFAQGICERTGTGTGTVSCCSTGI